MPPSCATLGSRKRGLWRPVGLRAADGRAESMIPANTCIRRSIHAEFHVNKSNVISGVHGAKRVGEGHARGASQAHVCV